MFLQRLYKEWRAFFYVVLVLVAAQLFFMYKGIENVPFFLYHMYSQRPAAVDSQEVYLVKTAEGYLIPKRMSNRQEELLMSAPAYYLSLCRSSRDTILPVVESRFRGRLPQGIYQWTSAHLSNSPAALAAFPGWWASYFYAVHPQVKTPVQLVKTMVSARYPFAKSPIDSVIFSIKAASSE